MDRQPFVHWSMKSKVFMPFLMIAVRSRSKCDAHELPRDVSEHRNF